MLMAEDGREGPFLGSRSSVVLQWKRNAPRDSSTFQVGTSELFVRIKGARTLGSTFFGCDYRR